MTRATAQPVVEVHGLNAHYGERQVLFDVSVDVGSGEIMVIMGGSGSGKSTLLRHLLGLESPSSGSVRVLGEDLTSLPGPAMAALRRKMGVAFQGGALFSSLSVAENIKLPLRELSQADERTMDIMARMKLEIVSLAHAADLMPAELSGGMLKRAAVARAIVMDPRLLFFDEPSAGLDPVVSSALDELILHLREAMGISIIVVTHEIDSAFKIADRMTILDHGHILAIDTPTAIRKSRNPRIQSLINRQADQTPLDPNDYLERLTAHA